METSDNFKVVDITFNPKRRQSDIQQEIEKEKEPVTEGLGVEFSRSKVPQIPTIERAIKYYSENAEGEYKKLYSATTIWLRKLMTTPKQTLGGVPENAEAEEQGETEV